MQDDQYPKLAAWVDAHRETCIADLQRVLRQPSISAQGVGVAECAALIAELMREIGMEAEVLPTDGWPVVYGARRCADPAALTLVIYNHYDVQPPDPVEAWSVPPFAADVDAATGRIVARGATDAKGNLLCHLEAVRAFLAVAGDVPLNVKVLFDGEEERGSPSLPAFVAANHDRLRADAALSFDGGFDASDRPRISLGTSGLLYVDIRVRGAEADLHSARARLVENPAWRLVWALGRLKDDQERIRIPGFYADVRPPTAADRAVLERSGWNDADQMRSLGASRFLLGVSGTDALERLLFQPTCNISGLTSGYGGDGSKTVLPAEARAKLDFRLVADQRPDDIFAKLVAYLAEIGCGDFEVTQYGSIEPSRTALDSPVAREVVAAARQVYGTEPILRPTEDASGRQGVWLAGQLGIPGAGTGIGPPAWRGHAPDEFITLGHYLNGIKYACAIWLRLAASLRAG